MAVESFIQMHFSIANRSLTYVHRLAKPHSESSFTEIGKPLRLDQNVDESFPILLVPPGDGFHGSGKFAESRSDQPRYPSATLFAQPQVKMHLHLLSPAFLSRSFLCLSRHGLGREA